MASSAGFSAVRSRPGAERREEVCLGRRGFFPSRAADGLENMLHQTFLSQPQDDVLYRLAGLASAAKWALALVFALLAIRTWRRRAVETVSGMP